MLLRRLFGIAAWAALRGAALAAENPAGLAAYVLGPHDQVKISALHVPEIPRDALAVDDEGFLHLPLVGRVRAGGKTLEQLETALRDQLKEYVLEPEVAVSLITQRNLPVSVIGSVKTPGVYQVTERKRLIEVLSLAGGLRDDAGPRLTVTRQVSRGRLPLPGAQDDPSAQFSLAEVEIDALTRGMNPALNIPIEPEDVISVRRSDLVYVIGEVKKPGGFTLREKESVRVLQALAMAEGSLATASAKSAKIMRPKPGTAERTEIAVNLKRVLQGLDPDVLMQPDDILVIPPNVPRSIALRTVEAAVQTATGVIIWRR